MLIVLLFTLAFFAIWVRPLNMTVVQMFCSAKERRQQALLQLHQNLGSSGRMVLTSLLALNFTIDFTATHTHRR